VITKKDKSGIAILVIVLTIVVGLIVWGYYEYNSQSVGVTEEAADSVRGETEEGKLMPVPVEKVDKVNQKHLTGNLVKGDTGGREWTLLYEEPGDPALTMVLKFDNSSICKIGKLEGVCDKTKFTIGDRVEVWGVEENSKLLVSRLNRIKEP